MATDAPKKKAAKKPAMTDSDYQRMCARMIELANRGTSETALVKSIAKAGNVKPVMDYVEKFKKLLVKFTRQQQG